MKEIFQNILTYTLHKSSLMVFIRCVCVGIVVDFFVDICEKGLEDGHTRVDNMEHPSIRFCSVSLPLPFPYI